MLVCYWFSFGVVIIVLVVFISLLFGMIVVLFVVGLLFIALISLFVVVLVCFD